MAKRHIYEPMGRRLGTLYRAVENFAFLICSIANLPEPDFESASEAEPEGEPDPTPLSKRV